MDSPDQNGTGSSENITQLLARWNEGDEKALEQLTPLVYDELHRLAANYLRKERRQHTLQPTALVNELYLKIFDQQRTNWRNRAQFFGVAACLMRRILVDYARAHYTSKRGSGRICISLRNIGDFGSQPDIDLMALQEALNRLQKLDPKLVQIVELRFFAGLTIEETAAVLNISHSTVEREWGTAKAFLKRELTRNGNDF
jgi:RNA polymerase sigma factor (TIGR02999 family)